MYDQKIKLELYAETRVQEYWVSDLQHDCVVAYSDLLDKNYRATRQFRRGEKLVPRLLPECSIPVDVLLP